MAYHDDLLEIAHLLAEREKPNQAALRRSVSSTYYAVFHFLISEAIKNWNRESSRNTLARMFDHGKMKAASESQFRSVPLDGAKANPQSIEDLKFVARNFVELQKKRHTADYDNNVLWEPVEALRIWELVCHVGQNQQ